MSIWASETAVLRRSPGEYEARVSGAWNIGENPNGGYLVSIALQAMSAALADSTPSLQDPMSVTAHYLRPGLSEDEARVRVEVVRVGRSVATLQATMIQREKPCLVVMAMFGDLSINAGVDQQLTIPAPEIPPPAACVRRSGETQGLVLPLMERVDVMLDPSYATPGDADQALIQGWIRMTDGSAPQSLSLPLFCDAFPPSPLTLLGRIGWVPTLELTVHVRQRPCSGWIKGRFATHDLNGGRMIESGALWDESGALVAQSRQIGLVMSAD